ncbi:hypothetical protein [Selenomonas sp. ND2010]|uniref:hypothetical protein n=1 Tax=Selenomonas sp. ND2010 TaxID=1410618 RepID=UPI00068DC524|nr:hypothetical protein [Selenomonas sp. ND2010]
MSTGKRYDNNYKIQAVKSAMEIGQTKATHELGISKSAITTWVRNVRIGKLDMGENFIEFGERTRHLRRKIASCGK